MITKNLGVKPRPSRTAFYSYFRGLRSSESRGLIFTYIAFLRKMRYDITDLNGVKNIET
jgi:hypothetical protein